MLETSTRLLELLALLQSRRDWPAAELAERLQVDARTVRRDVERLRRLGYPVSGRRGVGGGYRLGAGASLPPLLLDEDEAIAVAVGLRSAASAGVAGIEETSVRALAKLELMLPSAARRRVATLGLAMTPFPGAGPTIDPATLVAIAVAARDHDRLRLSYSDRSGTRSRRLVEPHQLVHTGRRWYLVAWDCGRDDWRTLRVDRIAGVPSPERRFEPREPPAADYAEYVARSIAATRERHQVRVLLRAPLAEVAARVPHFADRLEPLTADRCLLRAGSDWLGGLAVYIANIGVDFEVLDPPELADEVRALAERFARAAAASR